MFDAYDITVNLIFDNKGLVEEYIRVLKKSMIIPRYKLDWFREKEKKVRDCKSANKHSHKQYCKSAAFFAYDKTAQLEMIDHFPKTLIGKKMLRLEAQLRRNALRKWLPDKEFGNNWETIQNIYKSRTKIINWYLNRVQPQCKRYLRYEDVVRVVEKSGFKKKTRDRMLYLLRKTSDSESLTAALEKLREKYNLSKGQCRTVLKKFEKLEISPITLRNDSKFDELFALKMGD